ncbi:hypothetical protein M419DRAFT_4597 [Trichoderma reesei RUT C-30]|uniref:Uncharacterized protein n=1 Tax=Hypocrea jecorina (strain ATCC 56765 / BCRC 32924 / NRRL 11460 / Rut C-30) TaxID=1344414 RepID=A0A024SJT1_HYPJR|nr:hypothetical protein M419DRAFT_4597 [Trichoderma reesei RUT C-30]
MLPLQWTVAGVCLPGLPACLCLASNNGHWPVSGLARDAAAIQALTWLLHCAMAAYEAAMATVRTTTLTRSPLLGVAPRPDASPALLRIASLRSRLALAAPGGLFRLDCVGEAAVVLWKVPYSGQ